MISVIIPSVRDYRWKDIVAMFDTTIADFEIIVCGPCPPQDLGSKFRAIQTNVKGVQCIEIGVRHSKGEYIYITCDDVTLTPNILDSFLAYHLSCKESPIILSPVFKQLGVVLQTKPEDFYFPCLSSVVPPPVVPTDVFISRQDWNTLGGLDRNFVSAYWGLDLGMRCWAVGGKVVILHDVFVDEILPNLPSVGHANSKASFHQDIRYLLSLWTDGAVEANPGVLRTARSKPFEPFSDDNLLGIDQGVPDIRKKTCQGFNEEMAAYIRTGKLP